MFAQFAAVVSPELVSRARLAFSDGPFVSGENTAGNWNRELKKNLQLQPGVAQELVEELMAALFASQDFQRFSFPLKTTSPTINLYREGHRYAPHNDTPLRSGVRADLSYTLFLSDPDEYEGGELHLDVAGSAPVKLGAGSAFVYPSGLRHWVTPVVRGQRLAMFGWVQSMIRDVERRRVLREMNRSLGRLFDAAGRTPEFDKLTEIESTLVRMWAET